ncbi:unnamed protein product [Owenia fusiformis]|uniref:Glucuronosyltransferase n=1 Tax=Owenia fusiformis TaxID=6347 RepID=A0A8S4NRM0_OWEFU|nr:unnamed protein product [Owenia fusiformis]
MATLWKAMILFMLTIANTSMTSAGKILVFPYTSNKCTRPYAMERIAVILAQAGHDVTFLTHDKYETRIQLNNVKEIRHRFPDGAPYDLSEGGVQGLIDTTISQEIEFVFSAFEYFILPVCTALIQDVEIMNGLKQAKYDLMITDTFHTACGGILKEYLQLPTILWSNAGFEFQFEWLVPSTTSFIPLFVTSYTDEMTFTERALNTYYYLLTDYKRQSFLHLKYTLMQENEHVLGLKPSYHDSLTEADILWVNSGFAYMYPRPLMPNVIPVLGLKDKASKPLPKDFEEFINGAGEHGFILLSFGTLPRGLDENRREVLASVFAKLPQRVIWRYGGPLPKSLGNNTLIVSSHPQNDLLGHQKLRVFMTHCGASGSAEAIYNAAPIIGLSLFYDQRQHCTILTKRHNMGITISINDITKQTLSTALEEVLHNPVYKENALKARELMRDQPMNASYTIQYWSEYVMRHRGAKHLRSNAMHNLNFLQYFLIDIALVTLCSVIMVCVIIRHIVKLCLSWYKGIKLKQ